MEFNRGRSRVASTYLQADQFQTAGYRIYYLFRNSSGYRTVGIHDGIPDDRRESLRYYFVHEFLNGGVKSRSLNLSSSFSSSSFRSLIPRVGCSIYRERFIQRKYFKGGKKFKPLFLTVLEGSGDHFRCHGTLAEHVVRLHHYAVPRKFLQVRQLVLRAGHGHPGQA